MRTIGRALAAAASMVVLATLAACTLGPDPLKRPLTAAELAEAYVNAAASSDATPTVDRWWLELADPVTAELVERALRANTDLLVAAARVMAAEASLRVARGARLPAADLSLSASRQKSSFVLPSVGRVGIFSTTVAAELPVSYQVDLFGRLARAQQAAWAELVATEADRRALLHSVVASVVRSRAAIAVLERQVALSRATATSWKQSLELVERRYRAGLVEALDVRLTRQSWAAAQATVPQLETALALARHSLDVLLGRLPGSGQRLPDTLPELPQLAPPPPGLPVDLLERRPDLEASAMRLAAATARIGVALADLFPSLSLTASGGSRSDDLADLLSSETMIYNAVAALVAPVLAGGRLRAGVGAARAHAEEAAAEYSGAVLTALREVEDALVADAGERQRQEYLRVSTEEARSAARIASSRYEQGTGGLLAFLESERRRFLAENALLESQDAVWNARVDLLLALGGAWGTDEGTEAELASAPLVTALDGTGLASAPTAAGLSPVEVSP